MKFTYYDPKWVAKEGVKVPSYPTEGVQDSLDIVCVVKKEGFVDAVNVTDPAVYSTLYEGSCRVPHGVCKGQTSFYVVNKDLLEAHASDKRISVAEATFNAQQGRSA